jgi:hypothetical protein
VFDHSQNALGRHSLADVLKPRNSAFLRCRLFTCLGEPEYLSDGRLSLAVHPVEKAPIDFLAVQMVDWLMRVLVSSVQSVGENGSRNSRADLRLSLGWLNGPDAPAAQALRP